MDLSLFSRACAQQHCHGCISKLNHHSQQYANRDSYSGTRAATRNPLSLLSLPLQPSYFGKNVNIPSWHRKPSKPCRARILPGTGS